jgi:hypothetical protein
MHLQKFLKNVLSEIFFTRVLKFYLDVRIYILYLKINLKVYLSQRYKMLLIYHLLLVKYCAKTKIVLLKYCDL